MHMLSMQKFKDLYFIFSRNVFLLTNAIIFAVVCMLYFFGDTQAALFLGLILLLNMSLGLAQDLRVWFALEKLQLLTAPKVTRIANDKSVSQVLTDEIVTGDLIKLKTGDQVPCDGVLEHAESLELNEGLITGEADSLPRNDGATLLAGSIITSGNGILRVIIIHKA
jgi:cation-transporting ATPase E